MNVIASQPGPAGDDLVSLLLPHVPEVGLCDAPVVGVRLFRSDGCLGRAPCIYEPCVVFVLQGVKRAYLGSESFDYTPANYVVFSVPMPMEAELLEASVERPFLAMSLTIDPATITDLQMSIDAKEVTPAGPQKGITVSPIGQSMGEALYRLFSTFGDKRDAQVLGPMMVREIFYRVLLGNQGSILRAAVHRHGHYHRINQLLKAIQSDCAADLSTAEMARIANMSKTSLHDSFKSITTLTPLQYVKSIRLHRARALMINDGLTAGAAAYAVGYSSVSQFSREFKRLFGNPPSIEVQTASALSVG